MPAIRVCLFDLDGTLIDSINLILSSYRHAFQTQRGAAPPDDVWIAGIGRPLMEQLRELSTSEAETRALAASYREFQDANHERLLREFPGVREALSELRASGHAIGVVTSKMRAPATRGLATAGLSALVDVVIDYESTVLHKPHPEPVLRGIAAFGARPDECVYVGDSPHDIEAGRAAGVRTIATLGGPFPRERLAAVLPDAIVSGVADVPGVLSRWEASEKVDRSDDSVGRGGAC